ncbi:hypothetical protein M1446_02235 [Candidatus Dependentiae bacterium]|nr:hypothetical protein [Candidatus Dependentiae bacterium]
MKKIFIILFISFLNFTSCSEICAPTVTTIKQSDFVPNGQTSYVINTPGIYVLTTDIVFLPIVSSNAIIINTNGVTLDFNGKILSQGNMISNCNGIRVVGATSSDPRSDIVIQGNGLIKSFTNSGISVGPNVIAANTSSTRIKISNLDIVDCKVRGIELAGSASGAISNSEIKDCSISKCCTSVAADFGFFANNCIDLKIFNLSINNNISGSAIFSAINLQNSNLCKLDSVKVFENYSTVFQAINLNNTQNCVLKNCSAQNNSSTGIQILFGISGANSNANIFKKCIVKNNSEGSIIGFNIASSANVLNKCEVLSNVTNSGNFTGIKLTGGISCSSNILKSCLVSNNISTNNMSGYELLADVTKNSLEKCVAFSNISSDNLNNSNCYGFNLDRATNCILKNCRANQNESVEDGITNICAGFNISSSGAAGTGVKKCQFIGCSAIQNAGFNDERSFGIRAISSANGNQNNYFVKNLSMGNGRNNPIEKNQIVITHAGNSNEGGISLNSVESTSIDRLNNLETSYSNIIIYN